MRAPDCADVLMHLESYRREDASPDLAMLIEEHLSRCPECRRKLAHLKQVTAMMSAWRPTEAPVDLKVETAEAVSGELGGLARKVFPRSRPKRPRRRPGRSIMSAAQRVANALALAALVFLAVAILWRLWTTPRGGPRVPEPNGGVSAGSSQPELRTRFRLTLVRPGPPETEAEVMKLVREVTGAGLQEAEQLMGALPVTLLLGTNQADAEQVRDRFAALGVEASLRHPASSERP